jgi:D-alanyl-D-alanine carboxypeptidase
MEKWLAAALDYIPAWIDFQMRPDRAAGRLARSQPSGKPVLQQAFGHADAIAGVALTPRHRFRVASHSKSFTTAES